MDVQSLGVIPARGGSKRVRRKNLQPLGSKPLLMWTVDAARDSLLSRVVVSTEDVEIAALCKREGVETVPQPLGSALAGDMSAPVVLSALDFLRDTEGYEPEYVCLLHPTSPFRGGVHVSECLVRMRTWPGSVISFTADDLNGAIYVCRTETFRQRGSFFDPGPIQPYIMDAQAGLDIDTWDDLEEARRLVA